MTAQERPFIPLSIAVLTISDTRTLADDRSGDTLQQRLEAAGQRRLPPRVAGGGQGARRQSGSGATCYGLFDDASQAQRAAGAIAAANPGWWVRATVARPTHDRSAA